ncbi:MAG: GtrA family protein [Eubacteriales bacterium]|nr:GtrA family protein [Eubacteriales bacterium]
MLKKLFEKYSGIRYILSSFAAFLVDNSLYYVFLHFVFGRLHSISAVASSTFAYIVARVLSAFMNFNCNYFFVFTRDNSYKNALFKYFCLAVPQALVSMLLLDIVIANADFGNDLIKVTVKILIEAILFVISYLIQNKWVFVKKKQSRKEF